MLLLILMVVLLSEFVPLLVLLLFAGLIVQVLLLPPRAALLVGAAGTVTANRLQSEYKEQAFRVQRAGSIRSDKGLTSEIRSTPAQSN